MKYGWINLIWQMKGFFFFWNGILMRNIHGKKLKNNIDKYSKFWFFHEAAALLSKD